MIAVDDVFSFVAKSLASNRPIALSDDQVTALFRELVQPGFNTSHSELWQKEVAPNWINVETTNL